MVRKTRQAPKDEYLYSLDGVGGGDHGATLMIIVVIVIRSHHSGSNECRYAKHSSYKHHQTPGMI